MSKTTTFAAYDDQAIWGVGTSPEAAMANAVEFVNADDADALRASCNTAAMTVALAARVENRGGAIAFGLLPNGILGTGDEAFDAAPKAKAGT